MRTFLLSRRTALVAGVAALGMICAAARSAQQEPPKEFDNVRCIAIWSILKGMTPPVEKQAGEFRTQISKLQGWYDAILTMGPVPERDEWVKFHEDQRSSTLANKAKLKSSIHDLKIITKEASEFLKANKNFWQLKSFIDLNTATLNAELTINHAEKISDPPALPDPLPSKATPALEIVKWGYEKKKLVLGPGNTYVAEVRCNHKFTSAKGKVEARVRLGPARLEDPAVKDVDVGPHTSIIVKWRFTVTDEGDVKLGARIVR